MSGEVRDCACKLASHQHGTRLGYVVDKCRCTPCREAAVAYERNRRKQTIYGRYDSGRVDATPVRDHIQFLMANGVSYKQTAKLSGVSLSAVGAILYGRHERGHAPYPRVHKTTAEKILAVRPVPESMADGRVVDGTGTARRLRALVAIGWSQSRLAERLGIMPSNAGPIFHGRNVTAGTARAVRRLYNELWDQPQTGTDWHSKAAAMRSINRAAANGWLPPMAWDDETIDTPETAPADLTELQLHAEERIDDIVFLMDTGCGQAETIRRAGFKSLDSLERFCYRRDRGDVVYRLKRLRAAAA